jgi:hypothetical protein
MKRGIMPDSSDPPPRKAEAHDEPDKSAISLKEYHAQSDAFLDTLITRLEQRAEEKADIDCEYSVSSIHPITLAVTAPPSS